MTSRGGCYSEALLACGARGKQIQPGTLYDGLCVDGSGGCGWWVVAVWGSVAVCSCSYDGIAFWGFPSTLFPRPARAFRSRVAVCSLVCAPVKDVMVAAISHVCCFNVTITLRYGVFGENE